MTCKHCPRTATMRSGDEGFCSHHRTEAIAAMKALGQRKTGVGITVWSKKELAARR